MYLRDIFIKSYGTVQPQDAQTIPSSEKDSRILCMYHICLSCACSFLSVPLWPLLERWYWARWILCVLWWAAFQMNLKLTPWFDGSWWYNCMCGEYIEKLRSCSTLVK